MTDETETQAPASARARVDRRPALFIVLQCRRPTATPARIKIDPGCSVELGRGVTLAVERRDNVVRIDLPDSVISSTHAHIKALLDGYVIEDAGSKNGTYVGGTLQPHAALRDGEWIELGNTLLRFRHDIVPATDPLLVKAGGDELATLVPDLAATFARLAQVARASLPILVIGETGTGKEVIARAVHRLTQREGPFVAVNCGAIATTLLESELFGHRRGAFSGATDDRAGLFRSADRGTLLLDEIGELPAAAQAALLRVLQEREVVPVGGDRPIPIDIRLVAATHRDLEAEVTAGRFREDLYARLAGQVIRPLPLRERIEDLGLLVGRLLGRLADRDVSLDVEVARAFAKHEWPRNTRELEMTLASALAADPARITTDSLPDTLATPTPAREVDHERRRQLEALLVEHRGNVSRVAQAMGKARSLVQKWLNRYGLDAEQFRR